MMALIDEHDLLDKAGGQMGLDLHISSSACRVLTSCKINCLLHMMFDSTPLFEAQNPLTSSSSSSLMLNAAATSSSDIGQASRDPRQQSGVRLIDSNFDLLNVSSRARKSLGKGAQEEDEESATLDTITGFPRANEQPTADFRPLQQSKSRTAISGIERRTVGSEVFLGGQDDTGSV